MCDNGEMGRWAIDYGLLSILPHASCPEPRALFGYSLWTKGCGLLVSSFACSGKASKLFPTLVTRNEQFETRPERNALDI